MSELLEVLAPYGPIGIALAIVVWQHWIHRKEMKSTHEAHISEQDEWTVKLVDAYEQRTDEAVAKAEVLSSLKAIDRGVIEIARKLP